MDKYAYEERAAIMEFCGGLTRLEAEVQARREPAPPTKPPPMPTAGKATPGYLAFREAWHRDKTTNNRRAT